MQVISDSSQLQNLCRATRDKGKTIAFVPTMGCLHDGHLSLIKKAQLIADFVVISIFVNPLQFDNNDDLLKYPNTLDDDVNKLSDIGVDLVFTPDSITVYPKGEQEVELVDLGPITTILEGEHRPGHFAGVATVVKRLFEIVQPNSAIFGEKDFQQLMVIQQLVEQFSFSINIIGMPTLRERDGLAMSSRNIRLSQVERGKAPEIYQLLERLKVDINTGATNYLDIEEKAYKYLLDVGFKPEYIKICDSETLIPAQSHSSSVVILVAVKLGHIRLIDNLRV